jgi:multicomponent Na+:H+ antiporter subunit D
VFSGPLGAGAGGLRAVLLGAGVATALVGGVMCVLQQHLARLLAYATVSHVGLTLTGLALLGPAGLGGAVLYAVADGLIKGSLFISVGILLYHLGSVDELALRGRGRHLQWTAALLVLGALGLAGVPPFGTFLGKALMEEAAGAAGHAWLTALFVVVAALTAAALLRAAGRVFLGLGGPPDRAVDAPAGPAHATMLAPAALLLAGALAIGLVPGLAGRVELAAARFADRPAYAAAVLEGASDPGAGEAEAHPPGYLAGPAAWAALAAVLGLALGLWPLLRRRPSGPRRAVARGWAPALAALRRLHSGHIGDSVTWLVVGMATFGTLLALVVR